MSPEPGVTFPERRFIATRVDAGVETNIISSTPLNPNYSTDQIIRKQSYDNCVAWLDANPDVHVRIYSPTNGGYWTDSDCIWDSVLCGPLPVL